jgi:hypothetical protein
VERAWSDHRQIRAAVAQRTDRDTPLALMSLATLASMSPTVATRAAAAIVATDTPDAQLVGSARRSGLQADAVLTMRATCASGAAARAGRLRPLPRAGRMMLIPASRIRRWRTQPCIDLPTSAYWPICRRANRVSFRIAVTVPLVTPHWTIRLTTAPPYLHEDGFGLRLRREQIIDLTDDRAHVVDRRTRRRFDRDAQKIGISLGLHALRQRNDEQYGEEQQNGCQYDRRPTMVQRPLQ